MLIRFIDHLTPKDEIGLAAFPGGPTLGLSSDKAPVRKALEGTLGSPYAQRLGEFDIGLAEARTLIDKERYQVAPTRIAAGTSVAPLDTTPVMQALIDRHCTDDTSEAGQRAREQCRLRIEPQASEVIERSRADTRASVGALEDIVGQLAGVEGSKSLLLISSSLAIEQHRELDQLIAKARLSHTSFNVLIVDPFPENRFAALNDHPPSPTTLRADVNRINDDRRLRLEGLEEIAADGRGAVYRVAGNGNGILDRLSTELSASYVLGLESEPSDLATGQRKVEVTVKRPAARVRTAWAYINSPTSAVAPATASSKRPGDALIRDALSATSERGDVPVRVATYSRWDTASDKVRVNLTATVGAPGANAEELAVGYVVVDAQNKTVASAAQRPNRTDGTAAPPFAAALVLDPGVYALRLVVVDGKGKRSTVIRELNASRTVTDELATSDLVIGDAPAPGQGLTPTADPRVVSGKLAAYLELYSDNVEDLDWTFVKVEVAKDEKGEPLVSEDANVINGSHPSWRVASGVVDVGGLAPGAYVARARLVRDDKTLGVLTRPFVIGAPRSPVAPAPK